MPRLTRTPTGSTFTDEPPADEILAVPAVATARADWIAANRLAARRSIAARYARAELEQLRREGVAVPVLLRATALVEDREALATFAEAAAFAALSQFDAVAAATADALGTPTPSTGTATPGD